MARRKPIARPSDRKVMARALHTATEADIELVRVFHIALLEVRRIARTGTRNTAAWQEVIETVQKALAEGSAHRFCAAYRGGRQ
jgi:hypothetical protein